MILCLESQIEPSVAKAQKLGWRDTKQKNVYKEGETAHNFLMGVNNRVGERTYAGRGVMAHTLLMRLTIRMGTPYIIERTRFSLC